MVGTETKLYRCDGHFYKGNTRSPDNTTFAHFYVTEPDLAKAVGRFAEFKEGTVDVQLNTVVEVDPQLLRPVDADSSAGSTS
jgi:hypothetical protein